MGNYQFRVDIDFSSVPVNDFIWYVSPQEILKHISDDYILNHISVETVKKHFNLVNRDEAFDTMIEALVQHD